MQDCFCSAGYYGTYKAGGLACIECGRGKFSHEGATLCSDCARGKFNSQFGVSSCELCPALYTSHNGQAFCIPSLCTGCPTGKYSPAVDGGSEMACLDCQAGTYSLGSCVSCIRCPIGQFSDNHSSSCMDCPAGTYADSLMMSSCTECPAHTFHTETKATSISTCIPCADNYQRLPGVFECHECAVNYESIGGAACTRCLDDICTCPPGQGFDKSVAGCNHCPRTRSLAATTVALCEPILLIGGVHVMPCLRSGDIF